jgi:hypothetical protein
MQKFFTILIFTSTSLFAMGSNASDCLSLIELNSLSFDELDSAPLSECDVLQLISIVAAGQQLLLDTNEDSQVRADIYFNIVANELQVRKEKKIIDPHAPNTIFLLEQLRAQSYHLALTKPSDWEKLFKYASEGRWGYISKRFFDRGGHVYLTTGLFLLVPPFVFLRRRKRRKTDPSI